MKLIGYKSTSSGIAGLSDRIIRFRLKGIYSHTELVFEPGDKVEHLMPNGRLELYSDTQRWCASSSSIDRLPPWSIKRAGKRGGVRFKMIDIDPKKWDILPVDADPVFAANVFKAMEGWPYDYQLILSYLTWIVGEDSAAVNCSEICATALRFENAWRYDPCLLMEIVKQRSEICQAPSFVTR